MSGRMVDAAEAARIGLFERVVAADAFEAEVGRLAGGARRQAAAREGIAAFDEKRQAVFRGE